MESITVEGQRIGQGDDAGLDQWYFLNQYYRPSLTQQGRDLVDDARYAAEDNYRTLQRYGRYNLGALNTVSSAYDVLASTPAGTGAANLAFGYGSSVVGPSSFTQLSTWADENNVGTRVLGGLQALGGIAEGTLGGTLIATGVATSEVGVGIPIAAGGVALWALGADQTSTGLRRMLTGQYQPSAVEQTAMWAGATPQQASGMDRCGVERLRHD